MGANLSNRADFVEKRGHEVSYPTLAQDAQVAQVLVCLNVRVIILEPRDSDHPVAAMGLLRVLMGEAGFEYGQGLIHGCGMRPFQRRLECLDGCFDPAG